MVYLLTVCRNMNKNITPLPGIHCEFYVRGRCLYEERRNPGLNEAWQCAVLAGLVREYDRFLAQTEHFAIDDGTALRILEKRLDTSAAALKGCRRFEPLGGCDASCPSCPAACGRDDDGQDGDCRDGENQAGGVLDDGSLDGETGGDGDRAAREQAVGGMLHLACVHALDMVCILELPPCGGVCARYVRKARPR
ncbi:MAG: hypothetical protein AB7E47_17530 [Desulfovibrionaceae bacterium]